MDDREIMYDFVGGSYHSTQEVNQALFSLRSFYRKQLLEKLGEKKKCINCGTTNYDDHAVSCRRKLEQKGFNALHDYITSIINEVLPVGDMGVGERDKEWQ